MKWQYELIKEICSLSSTGDYSLSSIKIDSLVNIKKDKLPSSFFKFYAPTIENVSDIQNKLLWLSPPSYFNDPFDCSIAYNIQDFRKYYLEHSFDKFPYFSPKERDAIRSSYSSSQKAPSYFDWFDSVLNIILRKKSKRLQEKYRKELYYCLQQEIESKLYSLRENFRIACFSAFSSENDYFKNSPLMWSHYALSHKGFCVEYNLKPLFNKRTNLKEHYCADNNAYLSKTQQKQILVNGLFPVTYDNRRISMGKELLFSLLMDSSNNKRQLKEIVLKSLISKALSWKYESEWRLIVDKSLSELVGNKIQFPFSKRIIIGYNASKEITRMLKQVGKNLVIEVNQAFIDPITYEMGTLPYIPLTKTV